MHSNDGNAVLAAYIEISRRQGIPQHIPIPRRSRHPIGPGAQNTKVLDAKKLWKKTSRLPCICTAVHNVYMRDYLFRQTDQAGTYFKICHLLYHSTYICPILFSPTEHGEISIFVSLKL